MPDTFICFPTLNPIKSWGCKQLPSSLQPTINFIFLGFQRSIGGGIEQMNPYRPHIQMQQHLHIQVWENLQAERVNQKNEFSVTKRSISKTQEIEKG